MSIDTQRFMDLTQSLTSLWSSPFTVIVCQYFLWQYLGPASLAGLAVMLVTIPLDAVIAKLLKKLQISNLRNKDKRIRVMNEVLDGIKVLKLYAWESSFSKKIQDSRDVEIKTLKKIALYSAILTFVVTATPFFVAIASFGTYVMVDPVKNILTAEIAFVSMSFFNIMRQPLATLPFLIVQMIQAVVSLERVNRFLNAKEVKPDDISHDKDDKVAIDLRKASFTWDTTNPPVLTNISMKVNKGSLVAIVGQVGCGKSSLLSSLTGEVIKLGTVSKVNVDGSIAYVPQEPWIQNATLRYNVTFGKHYKEKTYKQVLDSCTLTEDLSILDAGDLTEIGEKGINLSGGQKQRTSLARAVYSNRDIYLLDDPLSAVDARVGKHIFENVIGPEGLLKNKTRLLVTNSITFLPQTDLIVVLKGGTISEMGTYHELLKNKGEFADYLLEHIPDEPADDEDEFVLENIKEELQQVLGKKAMSQKSRSRKYSRHVSAISNASSEETPSTTVSKPTRRQQKEETHPSKSQARGGLMKEETVETKSVKWNVYIYYLKALGLQIMGTAYLSMIITQAFDLATNIWLSKWSDDPNSYLPSIRNKYLGVYGALGSVSAVFVMISTFTFAVGGLTAAKHIHNAMLDNILLAPMSFFDTNPKGRVLNRFSKDTDFIDQAIPANFNALSRLALSMVSMLIGISLADPLFLVFIIPLGGAYWFVQTIYVKTARQLKRLESTARSPIYSLFSETLSGMSTIRAFNVQEDFLAENEKKVDFSQVSYQPNLVSTRWLSIRLEMLGNLIVLIAAMLAILGRDSLDPGIVGLSLTYASSLTNTLSFLIRQTSQIETNMVSVERVKEYEHDLPQEAPHRMPEQDPPEAWPEYGSITFKEYHTRYREGLDLVLKGISCQIMVSYC